MLGHNTTISLDVKMNRLALHQLGLITRADALQLGMSKDSLRRRVDNGLLVRVHPGVYRLGASSPTFEQRCLAATLAANDSVLSHRSAAVMHGLPIATPTRPEIVLPHGSGFRAPGIEIHQTSYPPSTQPWLTTQITTVASTLMALAAVVDAGTFARCLDHCIANRKTTVRQLQFELSTVSRERLPGRKVLEWEFGKRADGRVRYRSRLEQRAVVG